MRVVERVSKRAAAAVNQNRKKKGIETRVDATDVDALPHATTAEAALAEAQTANRKEGVHEPFLQNANSQGVLNG
jgi:hypothetical protein